MERSTGPVIRSKRVSRHCHRTATGLESLRHREIHAVGVRRRSIARRPGNIGFKSSQGASQRRTRMNTMVHGAARSVTLTLILTNLLLATSLADTANPSIHAPLFKPWINGVSADEPQMQVQRYDDDTYVIRQSI